DPAPARCRVPPPRRAGAGLRLAPAPGARRERAPAGNAPAGKKGRENGRGPGLGGGRVRGRGAREKRRRGEPRRIVGRRRGGSAPPLLRGGRGEAGGGGAGRERAAGRSPAGRCSPGAVPHRTMGAMHGILPLPEGMELDHIVYAVPDLAAAARDFARATGVEPAPGGAHPGWGTRNLLVGLGGRAYLEIIGPDPEQEEPGRPRPFGIDGLPGPGAVTWAVRAADLDGAVRRARAAGYDPGEARPMRRQVPGGPLLEWRLTDPDAARPGAVPFLIDWGDSPHPADSGLPEVRPLAVTLHHPDPAAAEGPLAALGLPVRVHPGPAGVSVTV